MVAGIGSGGLNADCQPDDLSFDTDVFANLAGIAAAAGSISATAECGDLPVVGGPGPIEISDSGEITQPGQIVDRQFQVPAGTRSLRVALNAEEGLLVNELDLAIQSGRPTAGRAGRVHVVARRRLRVLRRRQPRRRHLERAGGRRLGRRPLSAHHHHPARGRPRSLRARTQDALHRRRAGRRPFRSDHRVRHLAGRRHRRLGNAIELDSLGITSGGVFWFFNRENPEVLLKVLNGCLVNNQRWVFWSAGTNVRMTVRVLDRRTGLERVYQNPDLTPALPVTDIFAFDC